MNFWVWYLKNRTNWIVDFALFCIKLIEHFTPFGLNEFERLTLSK